MKKHYNRNKYNEITIIKYVLLITFITLSTSLKAAQNGDTLCIPIVLKDSVDYGAFKDSNTIELRNKILIFQEYENGMVIDRIDLRNGEKKRILDFNENDWDEKDNKCQDKNKDKMRGHWSGFEYGINVFVTDEYNLNMPDEMSFMELNPARSWNIAFNLAQSTLPIISDRVGIVTGMGFSMNHYYFENENSIQLNETTGMVEGRSLDEFDEIKKSRFKTTFLTVPALLEMQFGQGKSKDRFYIAAGAIGGLKIGSKTKIVHYENGRKRKLIERGEDLNINPWRLDLTARMGKTDAFNIYANYSVTTLFEKDKGPELYPISVGFKINFD